MNYEKAISCLCNQLNNCNVCSEIFNMPYDICCLYECHEHEFCKNCNDNGFYHENFKEWMEKLNENNNCGKPVI